MIIDGLKQYERDVVEPRHFETQKELATIKSLIQQGRGMLTLGGAMLTLASGIWIVLQIVHHLER